jgi:hypothetical protein
MIPGQLQRPFIDPRGVAETTLRDPYIGQGQNAPHRIRDIPSFLQMSHTFGKRLVRSFKITFRP